MARTKNAKRARVEGESSAFARLIASSHYMARWLPSPRTLNNYVEKFESRTIVPPRYITAEFIHNRHYNLVWNALQTQHLTDFVQTKDDYYPHLVRAVYSTLNYVVPEPDEEGESLQYENPHMDARGYAYHWTKIFTWLGIDLDEEKSVSLSNRQDRQTEAINRQGEAIDLLYTNLGITNPRGIIPRPGP
ncbi:hypothetical protein S83_024675 [Arachis hypogaea]